MRRIFWPLILLLALAAFAAAEEQRCPLNCEVLNESHCSCRSVPFWLTEKEPITVLVENATKQLMVYDVTDAQDACGVMVDKELAWFEKGDIKTVGGAKVVVFDIATVHAAGKDRDACKLFVAALITKPASVPEAPERAEEEAAPAPAPAPLLPESVTAPAIPAKAGWWQRVKEFFAGLFRLLVR